MWLTRLISIFLYLSFAVGVEATAQTVTALYQESREYLAECLQAFNETKEKVEQGECGGLGLLHCTRCYGELGCFNSGGHFFVFPFRPASLLPASREEINTRFYLYTRNNMLSEQELKANVYTSIEDSNFHSTREGTKFIIHGFLSDSKLEWVQEMKLAMLQHGDYNVIAVDWSGGSGFPYTLATANTRLVGAEIGLLVNYISAEFGLNPQDVHLVGHSLGAHICGYAGERIRNMGRITGLDPADPYFQGTDPEVRLDETDATFVDVIHTDAKPFVTGIITSFRGFGAEQRMGHKDFYPNGGKKQPGCEKSSVISVVISDGVTEGVRHFASCNHHRAITLMTDSLQNPREYTAYKCSSYEVFSDGKCIECSTSAGCTAQMGVNARASNTTGTLYLQTTEYKPFGKNHYAIQLTLSPSAGKKRDEAGDVYIQLQGNKGTTPDIKLNEEVQQLKQGTTYTYLLATEVDVGDVSKIGFTWECDSKSWNPLLWCSLRNAEIMVDTMTVYRGYDHTRGTYSNTGQPAITSKVKKYFH